MRLPKTFAVALCAGLYLIPLAGCEQEGPAEKAGKEMDRAVEDTDEKIKEATE